MNSTTLILIGVAVVLGLLLLAGGSSETPLAETTSLPTTQVAPTIPGSGVLRVDVGGDLTVGEREAVQLTGFVEGAAAGTLSYRWAAQGGPGFFNNPNIANPIFTAPSACDCEDSVLLVLIVTDASGRTAGDALILTVRDPLACPPDPCAPVPVCVPVDPCAPPVEATCPARPDVACETPCITEVPPADPCGQVVVPCPCVAGDCSSTWMTSWPFEPAPGSAVDRPTPRIARQFPSHIAEGASFKLIGTISNPGCAAGCFVWIANKGILEDADTLSPIYHAPMSDRPRGETATISLILYDGFGGRSYDQIRLTIDNVDYVGPAVP